MMRRIAGFGWPNRCRIDEAQAKTVVSDGSRTGGGVMSGGAAGSIAEQSSRFWERQWTWWHRIAPPLRPAAADIEILARLIRTGCDARGFARPAAVLMGVTPEIASMRWPAATRLLAIDRSRGMIDHVWPKQPFAGATAICGEWAAMPVATGSCDVITGDGCFSQLVYPDAYEVLIRELRRALRPRGLFAMRAFVRPEPAESVENLLSELNAGRIGNFHIFKWRLNMALQPSLASGIRLHDVWDFVISRYGNPARLAGRCDWPLDTVETIQAYRGSNARYTYPTLTELRAKLSVCFSEVTCEFPPYEMGDRCPTLLFERS